MKHIAALSIKIIVITFILLIILSGLYDFSFLHTVGLSILLIAISYIIGDIWLLKLSNNTIATAVDFLFSLVFIWLFGPFIYGTAVPFLAALISAVSICVGEWILHIYISYPTGKK
ncbi:DUF2512 family protein [Evansella halocellulosilytica]|uniref:DUF2512 family protein n=1 Tax=Evansella halocellulosilytica TaxID=2011013 RepID=UPI000BB91028|nr:DUF2512 family protein [Evansella halocellulosilytica]